MFAPRPTKNDWVPVLLACFTASSLASTAIVVRTENLPFTAVQVPRDTGDAVAPAAITPVVDPVRVLTVVLSASSRVSVIACDPPAEAMVPWFFTVTENVTRFPDAGVVGDHPAVATRSELCTGETTSAVGLV